MPDTPSRPTAARNVGPLIKFGVTRNGNLNCSACGFIEITVPPPVYNRMLAHLVLAADQHNREVHPVLELSDPSTSAASESPSEVISRWISNTWRPRGAAWQQADDLLRVLAAAGYQVVPR